MAKKKKAEKPEEKDELADVLDELVGDEETEAGKEAGEGEKEVGEEGTEGEEGTGEEKSEETVDDGSGINEEGLPDTVTPVDVETIPVSAITKVVDTNTREMIKGEAFDELVESIANIGMISPIHVKKLGKTKYQLIAGKRRLEAAKKIKMEFVPVVFVKKEAVNPEYISAIENLVRADLNPIEEARQMDILMKAHGKTQDELAKVLGVSQAHISQKLGLLEASKKIQKLLLNGEISEHQARKMMKGETKVRSSSIKVPEDVLPDDVTIDIKGTRAILKIRVDFVEDEKDRGKVIVEDVIDKMQELSITKFNKALKAVEREADNE